MLGGVLEAEKVMLQIGRRIAEMRENAAMTQDVLAEHAGMDPANLRAIESGKRNLTLRTLVALANAFECEIEEFLVPPVSRKRRRPGRPKKKPA